MIRENTGNIRDFGSPRPTWQLKKPSVLCGFCQNSLLNRSGNFQNVIRDYFGGSGNLLVITGNPVRVHSAGLARNGVTSGG
jgi:hypothetical protein